MKRLTGFALFLVGICSFLLSSCQEEGYGSTVLFSQLQANGSATKGTDTLTLSFIPAVGGMSIESFKLTPGETGATIEKLELTKEGTYLLALSGVVQKGEISVEVVDTRYVYTPASRTVGIVPSLDVDGPPPFLNAALAKAIETKNPIVWAKNADGAVSIKKNKALIDSIATLDISGSQVTQLEDLQHFGALTSLNCSANDGLSKIDFTWFPRLQYLECSSNRQLTSLELPAGDGLLSVKANNCALTSLIASPATGLLALHCSGNQLTRSRLNIAGLANLTFLDCSSNPSLEWIVLTGSPKLQVLNISNTAWPNVLDLSSFTDLQKLYCDDNSLTSLNISGLNQLVYLYCRRNQLTTLDVSTLASLVDFRCGGNQLTALDVSGLANLEMLQCQGNALLATLTLTGAAKLNYLDCTGGELAALTLTDSPNLTALFCSGNYLTALDVSATTGLCKFNCSDNRLSALDIKPLLHFVPTSDFLFGVQTTDGVTPQTLAMSVTDEQKALIDSAIDWKVSKENGGLSYPDPAPDPLP